MTKSITLNNDRIEIRFPYSPGMVSKIKANLPDRAWDKKEGCWHTPVSPYHAGYAADFAKEHKFLLAPAVADLVKSKARLGRPTKMREKLYPFQVKAVDFAHTTDGRCLFGDEMGLGKAQPLDAQVLTPMGWASMGQLEIGHDIFGPSGLVTVQAIYDRGVMDVYRVEFSDGSSTECTEDHLWQVNSPLRKWRGASSKVLSLKQIINHGLTHVNGNRQHFIPMTEPMDMGCYQHPVDPYMLGILIGDGSLSVHGSIKVSSADEEILDSIRMVLPNGISLKHDANYDYRITGETRKPGGNPLLTWLKMWGLMGTKSESKFVPKHYLISPASVRLEVLRGLLDSDGWIDVGKRGNHIGFCTVSPQLADDVVFLVRSFGGTATIKPKKTTGQLAYVIGISLPNGINPFRLKRKAELCPIRTKYTPSRSINSISYVGKKPVRCIKISSSDGLYLTDDFIVTHNTIEALAYLHETKEDALVVCPASVIYKWGSEVKKWLGDDANLILTGRHKMTDARVQVISYSLMARRYQTLRERDFGVIILDECFPKDTPITLADGSDKPIQNITVDESVMGLDYTGNVCYTKVQRTYKKESTDFIIINEHIRLTPNHPVYIEGKGYVEAKEITCGENMRMVHEIVSNPSERKMDSSVLLSTTRREIHDVKARGIRENKSDEREGVPVWFVRTVWKSLSYFKQILSKEEKILFPNLFNQMETHTSSPIYDDVRFWIEDKSRKEEEISRRSGVEQTNSSGIISTNEREQPNAYAGSQGEDEREHEGLLGKRSFIPSSWWQWTPNKATDICSPTNRMAHRNSNRDSTNRDMEIRNAGLSVRRIETSRGDRWGISQDIEATGNRSTQREGTKARRVSCSADTKQISRHGCMSLVEVTSVRVENTRKSEPVYNFQTETRNYFAHGILVHNCHNISNDRTQRARAANLLLGRKKIAMSGTPFLNRPVELWSILNWLQPSAWPNKFKYALKYCDAHKEFDHWDFSGASNLDVLRKRLEDIMIRRTKDEIADQLPSFQRSVIPVVMSSKEYNSIMSDTAGDSHLVKLGKIRHELGRFKVTVASDLVKEIIQQTGRKVVCYCIHLDVVDTLMKRLADAHITSTCITGSMSSLEREQSRLDFQDGDTQVMVITKAGGEGIELVAATEIVFVERDWNPGKEEQAESRLHRLSQNRAVTAHYIVVKDTIDEHHDRLIKNKRTVLDAAIGMVDVSTDIQNDLIRILRGN